MTETTGRAVAELVRAAMEAAGCENVRPDLCVVVDTSAGVSHTASAHGRRVLRDLESACREIAARWPLIAEPRIA